jgi:hypothetical protein
MKQKVMLGYTDETKIVKHSKALRGCSAFIAGPSGYVQGD